MNVAKVIKELTIQYPGKKILKNKNRAGVITEIICEIEPTGEHPEYASALAVIDSSSMHHHIKSTEAYKVIKGTLKVFKKNKEYILHKGNKIIIKPGEIHACFGRETWIKCYSKPGWTFQDHIVIDRILKKYLR
jgi:mannose-6-phosphate isomerase-like protein (cupin superfamily)